MINPGMFPHLLSHGSSQKLKVAHLSEANRNRDRLSLLRDPPLSIELIVTEGSTYVFYLSPPVIYDPNQPQSGILRLWI
jgi:hypothetical protein